MPPAQRRDVADDRAPARLAGRLPGGPGGGHGRADDPAARPGPDFRSRCRDLIAQAAADGRCPAVHFACVGDHCAVDQGEPQFHGTRTDPATLRPHPVRHPRTLDERRHDVGRGPLEEQSRALRLPG
ncbi:DUF6624 domain-containing protein [Streptomyces sennicomposti]